MHETDQAGTSRWGSGTATGESVMMSMGADALEFGDVVRLIYMSLHMTEEKYKQRPSKVWTCAANLVVWARATHDFEANSRALARPNCVSRACATR